MAYAKLEQTSLHQLVVVRDLKLVDLPMLANLTGLKLRDVVQAKGQGSRGYDSTSAEPGVHGMWRRGRWTSVHIFRVIASRYP